VTPHLWFWLSIASEM